MFPPNNTTEKKNKTKQKQVIVIAVTRLKSAVTTIAMTTCSIMTKLVTKITNYFNTLHVLCSAYVKSSFKKEGIAKQL